jgi:hypothetical protein
MKLIVEMLKIIAKKLLEIVYLDINFVSTVRVTLPIRTVSKDASFTFKQMPDSQAVRHFYF